MDVIGASNGLLQEIIDPIEDGREQNVQHFHEAILGNCDGSAQVRYRPTSLDAHLVSMHQHADER